MWGIWIFAFTTKKQAKADGRERLVGSLTLFGIMTSCCALLMEPDSSLPRITVPMSWWDRSQKSVTEKVREEHGVFASIRSKDRTNLVFPVELSHQRNATDVLSVYKVIKLSVLVWQVQHGKKWLQPMTHKASCLQREYKVSVSVQRDDWFKDFVQPSIWCKMLADRTVIYLSICTLSIHSLNTEHSSQSSIKTPTVSQLRESNL